MIYAPVGIDAMFNCASVFLPTKWPAKQGPVGAFANGLVCLGIAFLASFREVVQINTADLAERERERERSGG